MGPSMNHRCDTEACVGDNVACDKNPQEGQGGESALACREPHCYTWGTPFSARLFLTSFVSHASASSYMENSFSLSLNSFV